jgi:hypothetical protein
VRVKTEPSRSCKETILTSVTVFFSCLADGGNEGFHCFEVWVLHEIGDTPLSRVVTTDAARLFFE